jgi:hypothetical protein
MREDLERRRHHKQPRRHTTHWHNDQLVPGPVDACPVCTAKDES